MAENEFDRELRETFGWGRPQPESAVDRVMRVFFTDRGFEPRTFQRQAIAGVAGGGNLLLVAGTAQGKTEAVIVPVAARLIEWGRRFACCYLAPTRALLNDLHGRLEYPLSQLGLRAVVRHGDRPIDQDDPDVDLLLTTPESLDVMLVQGAEILKRMRIVVVDEVHQLYGTARGAHVVSVLERLKWRVDRAKNEPLQRVALSATVGDPERVAEWLAGSDGPTDILHLPIGRAIDARVEWSESDHDTARRIAGSGHQKILVFVNSRAHCEDLASTLSDRSTAEVLVHYSDLDAREREYVEDRFRRADQAICVATGTLELGIDIGTIDAVAMADPAFSVQAFLQRIGRAARTEATVPVLLPAGSEAILAHQLALLSLARRGAIEDEPYPEWFSVLAQQILSMVAGNDRRRIYEKLPIEIFGCWSWFDAEAARQVLDGLASADFLQREEQIRSYRQSRNLSLALDSWGVSSNIAGGAGGLALYNGQQRIGAVDVGRAREGDVLRYAGRHWRIIGLTERGITVEPSEPVRGARMPRWSGFAVGGLSHLVAQEMRALLSGTVITAGELSQRASERWQRLQERVMGLPTGLDVVWEYDGGNSRTYYTFGGDLDNDLLRRSLDQQGLVARRTTGRTLSGTCLKSDHALEFAGASEDALRQIQRAHWRDLRRWTQTGPYFDQLPPALQRREVLAQLDRPGLIGRLMGPREIVRARTAIFQ